jgi:hypothetical protein
MLQTGKEGRKTTWDRARLNEPPVVAPLRRARIRELESEVFPAAVQAMLRFAANTLSSVIGKSRTLTPVAL